MSVQALSWVFDHSPTSGTDRLVLLSIANHAGATPVEGAWEAWPGIDLIQHEAGLERRRTVQDALARLVAAGAIERKINQAPDSRIPGDRRPNLYRILGVPPSVTPLADDGVPPERRRGDAPTYDGVTDGDATGCRDASPKPSLEPSPQPSGTELRVRVAESHLAAGFEEFWSVYPRNTAKGQARKVWPAAVKAAGGMTPIIDGARRYLDDPNRDPGYTAHAATWLRGERWNDDPIPGARSPRQHRKASATEAFVGGEEPTGTVASAFFGRLPEQKEITR